jgi:hypothetical protein
MYYGLDVFGETFFENVIFAGCFIGLLNGINIMGFGFVCAFDFKRRFNAMKRLGELINFPGIPLSESFFIYLKRKLTKMVSNLMKILVLILRMTNLGDPRKPLMFLSTLRSVQTFLLG